MATTRSRATDISYLRGGRGGRGGSGGGGGGSSHTRRLQEGLYTYLDEQERTAFVEVLNTYGVRKDILELVNSLRKILNTPVKRQLFPLVRGVIRRSDVEAFDLLTRGGKNYGTLPRPFLYRPHAADLAVLRKHRFNTQGRHGHSTLLQPPPGQARPRRKASSLVSEFSDRDYDLSWQSSDREDAFTVFIETRDPNYEGFGFNIRGGSEYGLGVYVSSVDEGGPAEIQGLQVGDLIVEANDISFRNISHGEAARILKAATRLELSVCRVGRVPDRHTVHEAYRWVDPRGRPVSPPPDLATPGQLLDDADTRSRSSLNLLKSSDERKVNVVVDRGQTLGLTVRGGRDYGLGIYVSGVDPFSVAENAGLKVGDQILDVNGQNLLGLSHAEAVRILTRSRHMVMTVKDVGRVPYAKTTIDRTQWLSKEESHAQRAPSRQRFTGRKSLSEPDLLNVGFSRGAGSQLMLSAMSSRSQQEVLEEQARILLNTEEQATLRYYLAEYQREAVQTPGLVAALRELLNTGAKFTLIKEIRTLIRPRDLDVFDRLIHKHDINSGSLRRRTMKSRATDSLSLMSGDSADAFMDEQEKRTLFSSKMRPAMQPKMMEALTDNNSPLLPSSSLHSNNTNSFARVPSDASSSTVTSDRWDRDVTVSPRPSTNGAATREERRAAPRLTKPVPFSSTKGAGQPLAFRRVKPVRQTRPSPSFIRATPVSASPPSTSQHNHNPHHQQQQYHHHQHSAAVNAATAVAGNVALLSVVPSTFGGSGSSPRVVGYTKAEVHPRGKPPDDPSDDSGVEVRSNPRPLDPRTFLAADGGRFNPHRQSKRVTISKDDPVEIENVGRQPPDNRQKVASPAPAPTEERKRLEGREKYGDIPLAVVYIYRCKPTLGVAIEGGANTRQPLPRVVTVQPGGSAFESGGLRVGHVILEVNGEPLAGKSHTEVARLIAETFKNQEEGRMELLVTDSSETVMDELRERLAELAVDQ